MTSQAKCIIYTRFSPRPDASTSESCEVQRAYCTNLAAQRGWQVEGVYDDPDRSGSDEFRDKLWNAVRALKKGWKLVVFKRDRLARDVYLAAMIDRQVAARGARIVACQGDVEGDSPETVLIRQVVAAMAEYERKAISARTRAAMMALQAKGRRMSKILPYGWDADPDDATKMVRNEKEQAIIERMISLRDEGLGYRTVAARLNEDPGTQARNGNWSPKVVRGIISRCRKYA